MDGPFGFEVWRQRRDDLLREVDQARLARAAGVRTKLRLLNALSGIFVGRAEQERAVASKPEIRRIPARERRCKSRAA